MLKCSNVQMFKYSNVPMFQCSNVPMIKYSHYWNHWNPMFKCSNVQMFKCSKVQMCKVLMSNVTCQMSNVKCQMSNVKYQTSNVNTYVQLLSEHTSEVTPGIFDKVVLILILCFLDWQRRDHSKMM